MPEYRNWRSPERASTLGRLPANCDEMTLPERSMAEMVLPVWPTEAEGGTDNRITLCSGSNTRSLADRLRSVTANPVPAKPFFAPVKNVDPADVPPFATGLATVIIAVPGVAMSAAGMAAVNWVLETKVVGKAPPLNCTVAAGSKPLPFTVMVKAAPPAMAKLGLNSVITGAPAAGVGGGAGSGVAAGVAADTGLTKLPPTKNTLPLSVLNAKPFWPQRISRRTLPFTLGMMMEPT